MIRVLSYDFLKKSLSKPRLLIEKLKVAMTKDLIKKSLETGELQLTFWQKEGHFGIVFYVLIIPAFFLFFFIADTNSNNFDTRKFEIPIIVFVSCGVSLLIYRHQRQKLKFVTIATKLDRADLAKIIAKAGEQLEWKLHFMDDQIFIAKTFPGFWSGSWGEQVTIIFDNEKILINSICDPDNRGSFFSNGRNRRNVNLLVQEVQAASR